MASCDDRALGLIERMRDAIDAYRQCEASVEWLSSELRGIIAELENIADDWVVELRAMRDQIEYVNAFMIDLGRGHLTADERHDVADTLDELSAALVAHDRRG